MPDVIGWLSSLILLATIAHQVGEQWRDQTSRAQSRWLFAGQTMASVGFTVYSVLVKNWVFTVTNALLLVSACVGLLLAMRKPPAERQNNSAPTRSCMPRAEHGSVQELDRHAVVMPGPHERHGGGVRKGDSHPSPPGRVRFCGSSVAQGGGWTKS